MLESVIVKPLTTKQQFEQVKTLEQEIWQRTYGPMHEAFEAMSSKTMVIGAFLNEELIGFNYSEVQEQLLYSHLLGIKRTYREAGVGELLKLKQKELAQERELAKCKWVFEPLEAHAAYLNFTKLGGFSTQYIEEGVAEMGTPLIEPVDRLCVELDLMDTDYLRWQAKIDELKGDAAEVVGWELNLVGLPILKDFDVELAYLKDAYVVPIPTNIMKITIESMPLALDWRYKTRGVFTTLFAQGYAIVQLVPTNEHVSHYLFVKRSLFAL